MAGSIVGEQAKSRHQVGALPLRGTGLQSYNRAWGDIPFCAF